MSLTPTQSMSAPAAWAARKRFLPIRPNPLIPADTAIGSSFRVVPFSNASLSGWKISGPSLKPCVSGVRTRILGGTMKRLLTLMFACAAILVMGIAVTGVRADDGGSGDSTQPTVTPSQPCGQDDQ